MKKKNIKEMIYQAKQVKTNMEKLNRAQKCLILGPQNLCPPGSAPVFHYVGKRNVITFELCRFVVLARNLIYQLIRDVCCNVVEHSLILL